MNFSVLYQENKKYLLKLKEALFVVRDRHTHTLFSREAFYEGSKKELQILIFIMWNGNKI